MRFTTLEVVLSAKLLRYGTVVDSLPSPEGPVGPGYDGEGDYVYPVKWDDGVESFHARRDLLQVRKVGRDA